MIDQQRCGCELIGAAREYQRRLAALRQYVNLTNDRRATEVTVVIPVETRCVSTFFFFFFF
jgi:hypothetical protein